MLNEYAYLLAPGGILYTITDVKELGEWMARHGTEHSAFERIPDAELVSSGHHHTFRSVAAPHQRRCVAAPRACAQEGDEICHAVREATEEGKKVARNGGSKYLAVFRRLAPAEGNAKAATSAFFPLAACGPPVPQPTAGKCRIH